MGRADEKRRKRNEQIEFNAKMALIQEQWRSDAQKRFSRGDDNKIKVSSHGQSMAERSQKMAVERIRLAMEVANHKADVAGKWLKVNITREELIQMRVARKEWRSALNSLKVQLRMANKKTEKLNRWLDAMEQLIWGSLIEPKALGAAWRGMFGLIKTLPRGTQRMIVQMKYGITDSVCANFFKPSNPNADPEIFPLDLPRSNRLMALLDWCKDNRFIPADGSNLQQRLFQVMEIMDVGMASIGAEHQAHVQESREELKLMRSEHWKKNKVT